MSNELSPSLEMEREYTLLVHDRTYSAWNYIDSEGKTTAKLAWSEDDPSPFDRKWFSRDRIRVDSRTGHTAVVSSPVRERNILAGVLVLYQNRSFGRTENKKRLLYKCIPDDRHLPPFLLPFEIKLGFSKSIGNKYVLFAFDHWNDKYPRGILRETLGDVDQLDVFYEYQLYSRGVHSSLTEFTQTVRTRLGEFEKSVAPLDPAVAIARSPEFRIIDRTEEGKSGAFVFSIDPAGSTDFDDAFSIRQTPLGNRVVSVYIANVYVWMETLGLWDAFSPRVSTLYLPDRKRPLLPSILSDSLCSLQEKQARIAFCVDLEITPEGEVLEDSAVFRNVLVRVSRNYVYESDELVRDGHYTQLRQITQRIDPTCKDSHDVVAHWMVRINTLCGGKMGENRCGIFRHSMTTSPSPSSIPPTLSTETLRFIHHWRNTRCEYVPFREDTQDSAGVFPPNYIHITSPIRRLVDVVNQSLCMEQLGMISPRSPSARGFCDKWMAQLDYVNETMRSIRKVQTECELLRAVSLRPEWLSQSHRGVVFEKTVVSGEDSSPVYSYRVYIEELRFVSRVYSIVELELYRSYSFRLFLFEDEENIRNKIRVQLEETVG